MSTTFFRAADAVHTLVVGYTPGSGQITLQPGGGLQFAAPLAVSPILITVVTAATYGVFPETLGEYSCTGVTGDILTGLTLVNGTDNAWAFGDIVEMRVNALHINNLQDSFSSLVFLSPTSTQTAAFTAIAGDFVVCDSTSGAFPVTLPLNVPEGTLVGGILVAGTNPVTFSTQGTDVINVVGTTSLQLTTAGQTFTAVYELAQFPETLNIWYVTVPPSSGGGTPGGTNGQIQFNNNGAFGGFTASGDATINTSTGAIAVSSIGAEAVSLGGALTTSGSFTTTITVTANTNVTLPTSGTLVNTSVTTLSSLSLPAAQVTGLAASATTDTTNAANISSGTLPAARLPTPTAGTLGGIESLAATTHQWINAISTAGVPSSTQPAFTDLSGQATLAQLPTIGAGTILGNPTAGSAVPSALVNIAANADGSLTLTPITHSSPGPGDLWFPSSDQGTFSIGRASGQARLGGCIFSCGSCTAIANLAVATSVFGSPTNAKGSLTIPAGTLAPGNLLRWYLTGVFSTTASAPTIAFNVLLNGATILGSIAANTFGAAANTSRLVYVGQQNYISILSVGSSATAAGISIINLSQVSGGTVTAQCAPGGSSVAPSATFNSATNALFDITVTWGTANASNSFQITSFDLFIDN